MKMVKLIGVSIIVFLLLGVGTGIGQEICAGGVSDHKTVPGKPFNVCWENIGATDPDIVGFRLYMSRVSGVFVTGPGNEYLTFDVANCTGVDCEAPITGLTELGDYYFAVAAFVDDSIEADTNGQAHVKLRNKPRSTGCSIKF